MDFLPNKIKAANYFKDSYLSKERWVSYYWQTHLIKSLISEGKILEVGIGNKIVSNCLKSSYEIISADINENLNPDFAASVDNLAFAGDETYDLVLCAEVLEHLPFDRFLPALHELKRVSKKYLIISLPYWGYTFGFRIRLPLLKESAIKFKVSKIKKHQYNGQHYWEIGKRGYSLKRIKQDITSIGLKIRRSFWDLDDPYHYYFVLEK